MAYMTGGGVATSDYPCELPAIAKNEMVAFIMTKWHEENPNSWVAVKRPAKQPYVLIDRDKSLVTLHLRLGERAKDVVFGRAWSMGIGKDYPMGDSKE